MGDVLAGTSWTVVELRGEPTRAPRPRVAFGEDGRVGGTTGLNRLVGTYAVDADGLLAIRGATTLMAGPEPAMSQESAFLAVIATPVPVTRTADRLELAGPDGSVGAVLVPAVDEDVLV